MKIRYLISVFQAILTYCHFLHQGTIFMKIKYILWMYSRSSWDAVTSCKRAHYLRGSYAYCKMIPGYLIAVSACNKTHCLFVLFILGYLMTVSIKTIALDRTIKECGAVCGMRIWNQSTLRKPAWVPLCPLQIPHDLTWDWPQGAIVGSRWLTTWAMTWPFLWGSK
jgi:hypothetical protein